LLPSSFSRAASLRRGLAYIEPRKATTLPSRRSSHRGWRKRLIIGVARRVSPRRRRRQNCGPSAGPDGARSAARRERPRDGKSVHGEIKANEGDSWQHTKIPLKPINRDFAAIVIENADDGAVEVIAEFVEALGTSPPVRG
jgi:hypothetical protein